ncbi:phosphatidylserine synthase [Photobacterium aquae]|uniref:phospholipase D n=1 Tax=Photobacterium aquae TaxID=1195763 RepID=A0A0J1HBA1_9GAMM|nr:phospholipase D-like domain-containing protein [Photobacterium aquae]KLV08933.1 phosphatidylserine synthase [Photobacterium aquae]
MAKRDIETLLVRSFDDAKLDNHERRDLADALEEADLKADGISYLRNRAFSLVQQSIRDGDDGQKGLKWLEQVMKQLDKARGGNEVVVAESWFSPGNCCIDGIRNQLKFARNSVDICVFTIADDNLTDAILAAHHRGVKVRIITDNDKVNDSGSDIDYLARHGVMVKVDETQYHMHHKFAIFDNSRLINGSFNWTRSASKFNSEDLTMTNDSRHLAAFTQHFDQLWRDFPLYGRESALGETL